ncbi:MAG: hypothetical protein M1827_002527 [Pycnora praestabilis]|nr:MAG: hypothetical protein M1827_002527 [Pycnora praestabilis]
MASSPPGSPLSTPQRPLSALIRPSPRPMSRMSMSSRPGGGSRASDDEGKTLVKVAVRVRPPLKPTDPGFDLIPQRFQRSMVQVTSPTSLAVDCPQGRKLFVFDKVFDEDVEQEGVWQYLNESVQAFVQGYNVSLLAYGQSGAGKSYTMGTSGPTEQSDATLMGVIPRAARVLFDKLSRGRPDLFPSNSGIRTPTRYSVSSSSVPTLAKGADKDWVMKATYVEIYNEQLRDLLLPDTIPYTERNTVSIREDTKGRILLTGLHQITINSIDDLLEALNFGSSIRQTDATAINAKSSRSHAVFSLNLVQRKNKLQTATGHEKRFSVPLEAMNGADNWITVDSKFNFVDLAGSERLKNTGASGERAKEGISINAGLASLGKVISQLSSRQAGSHVSYRDSKLTRLLQDSLGGNAITYMIACVTPADFHLSETLNTVQYAQRARAIQSKPRIQQVSDERDKQALIDRLRAEVSFLRDQMRNTEHGDRRSNVPQERVERQNEREIELHNHLLDIQENYSALSHRHAKLISEITKARDTESAETPTLDDAIGNSAVERLKRSNSFAEAVEQVVLEYEKTIQSLETSLSNTRSSLSSTESSLLERETKCAYVETINQQLQARIQKLVDRESSTDNYLHDLEAKLDGHTSGEEKHLAIVSELRKEISRVRDNETSCEDYISTLEERLAEADQDVELMQREIERLEHVVERQRSLGKLDNLLYELDHIHKDEKTANGDELTNGHTQGGPVLGHNGELSQGSLRESSSEAEEFAFSDRGERLPRTEHVYKIDGLTNEVKGNHHKADVSDESFAAPKKTALERGFPDQSAAQLHFVAEKLENVTQELFDLRIEHESSVSEYDLLAAKYEEALRTLAQVQDSVKQNRQSAVREPVVSEASTRPTSFSGDARMDDIINGGHLSSSRSLSSELSLAAESPIIKESPNGERTMKSSSPSHVARSLPREESLAQEMEHLENLQAEKEHGMAALTEQYAQLQEQHQETLDVVEELKAEIQKVKLTTPTSPTSPIIHRKSSLNMMTIDRAHRAFASLRNIATENFEEKPDIMQNFDLNLNTAMHELYARSERVQAVETELANVKKEMETKMTIISGLTRERSSMKGSSPMDISVVASMRDQLLHSEDQIKVLHETHAARERDLLAEIQSIYAALEERMAPTSSEHQNGELSSVMPGVFPETPMFEFGRSKELGSELQPVAEKQDNTFDELQAELAQWEGRHQSALDSMQASEKQLLQTIGELEVAMSNVEVLRAEHSAELNAEKSRHANALSELEDERAKHQEDVLALRNDIEEHRTTIRSRVDKLGELEQSHASTRYQLEEAARYREATEAQLSSHHEIVSNLEQQIEEHQSAVKFHQHGLKSLHDSHTKELQKLETSYLAKAQAEADDRLNKAISEHEEVANGLQAELAKTKGEMTELLRGVSAILNEEVVVSTLQHRIEGLLEERGIARGDHTRVLEELVQLKEQHLKLNSTVEDLTTLNEGSVKEIERVSEQAKKSARLVEELEEQLTTHYDQHQHATNRLSVLQTKRDTKLEEATTARFEAEKEAEAFRTKCAQLESQLSDTRRNSNSARPEDLNKTRLDVQRDPRDRSNSLTNNSRKSTAVANLPSPPPAIPLPPLPNNAPGVPPSMSTSNTSGHAPTSPTQSNLARHPSKDLAHTQLAEDQEARIRTIEKHLYAEKQLTATLEEALVDLEMQGNKVKADMESWKKKAWSYEDELQSLRKERNSTRYSIQAIEEERQARREAEAVRAQLEERMNAINKKKKKTTLNCF